MPEQEHKGSKMWIRTFRERVSVAEMLRPVNEWSWSDGLQWCGEVPD